MTDLVDRPDLLPPDDTRPVPAAIVAVDGRLDDADVPGIIREADVDRCAPAFLKFLAWEQGVDVWRDSWPDTVKRAVIKASPDVKRHKGTVYAVERALGAFGISTEVVEWWQETPRGAPYSFKVTAFASGRLGDGALIDADLITDVFGAVIAAKPVSRGFALRIAGSLSRGLGLAPVAVATNKTRAVMHPRNEDEFASGLGVAAVTIGRVRVSAVMIAST